MNYHFLIFKTPNKHPDTKALPITKLIYFFLFKK